MSRGENYPKGIIYHPLRRRTPRASDFPPNKLKWHMSVCDKAYFENLAIKHPDLGVRIMADRCLKVYGTDQWKSKTMRRLVADLSWALHEYLERQ